MTSEFAKLEDTTLKIIHELCHLKPMNHQQVVVGGSCPPHYYQDSAQNCLEPPSKGVGHCSLDSQTVHLHPHHDYASYLC